MSSFSLNNTMTDGIVALDHVIYNWASDKQSPRKCIPSISIIEIYFSLFVIIANGKQFTNIDAWSMIQKTSRHLGHQWFMVESVWRSHKLLWRFVGKLGYEVLHKIPCSVQIPFLRSIWHRSITKSLLLILSIRFGRSDLWLRWFSISIVYLRPLSLSFQRCWGFWTFSFPLVYL